MGKVKPLSKMAVPTLKWLLNVTDKISDAVLTKCLGTLFCVRLI